jgi:hypothetical protein
MEFMKVKHVVNYYKVNNMSIQKLQNLTMHLI